MGKYYNLSEFLDTTSGIANFVGVGDTIIYTTSEDPNNVYSISQSDTYITAEVVDDTVEFKCVAASIVDENNFVSLFITIKNNNEEKMYEICTQQRKYTLKRLYYTSTDKSTTKEFSTDTIEFTYGDSINLTYQHSVYKYDKAIIKSEYLNQETTTSAIQLNTDEFEYNITVYYDRLYRVTLNHYEDGTNDEVDTSIIEHPPFTEGFTLPNKTIAGYKLVSIEDNNGNSYQVGDKLDLSNFSFDIIITYFYSYEIVLTLYYREVLDANLNTYKPIETTSPNPPVALNTEVVPSQYIKEITHFEYTGKTEPEDKFIFSVDSRSVAIYYVRKNYTLTIKYLDNNGKTLREPYTITQPALTELAAIEGINYTISDYTLTNKDDLPQYLESDGTYELIYIKNTAEVTSYTLTLSYVDNKTNTAISSSKTKSFVENTTVTYTQADNLGLIYKDSNYELANANEVFPIVMTQNQIKTLKYNKKESNPTEPESPEEEAPKAVSGWLYNVQGQKFIPKTTYDKIVNNFDDDEQFIQFGTAAPATLSKGVLYFVY